MEQGEQRAPERTSVVLGVALALVALAGLAWVLATQRTGALDAREVHAQWFEPHDLPLGLELAEAQRLPRGDVVLRLALAGAEPEAPRIEPPAEVPPDPPPFDWSQVPVGSADTPPREVLIVELPLEEAAADL